MRILRYALPLALLLASAPASAQPNGPRILHDAIDRLAADVTEVDDYTFALASDELRIPVYVHRTGQSWEVRFGRTPLEDVAQMAVFWPGMLDPSVSLGLRNAAYLRQETVDGRPAHVIDSPMRGGFDAEVDSVRLLVDTETGRVVRMVIGARLPAGFGSDVFGENAGMDIQLHAGEQRVTDGLSLPAWVRVRMRLELPNLPAEQRARMLERFREVRGQLRDTDTPEARDMLAMVSMYVQLLSPDGMDVRMRVEDVAVNPGRPGWLAKGAKGPR